MSEKDIEVGREAMDVELPKRTTPRQPMGENPRTTPRQPRQSPRPEQLEAQRSSPKNDVQSIVTSSAKSSNPPDTQAIQSQRSSPRTDQAPTSSSSQHAPHQTPRVAETKDSPQKDDAMEIDLTKLQRTPQQSDSPTKAGVQSVAETEHSQPKVYEPIRTNPLRSLDTKRRRLDRLTDESVPEVHIVGEIKYGMQLANDLSEGVFCRYKVDIGKTCQPLGGEFLGQTQVAYGRHDINEPVTLGHPIDIHFGMTGLQGWGSPRISIQAFRLDWFGRRILHGYGFTHIPLNPGKHRIEVSLWRPIGTPNQELRAYLLGEIPALVNQGPLYDSAWKDRCRLLTTSSGSIFIEIFVVTRFLKEQGIIQRIAL